jgi:hypothetical protein
VERGKTRIEADDVESAATSATLPGILKEIETLRQKLDAFSRNRGDAA